MHRSPWFLLPPRKTIAKLFAPTVIAPMPLAPAVEQQLRTISVRFVSRRTRVDLRRRAPHPILWPPGEVQGSSLPVLRGISSSSVAGVGAPLVYPAPALVRAPPWRFAVTTLATETLTFLDRIAYKKQVVFTLNKATSMSGTVDSDNPEIFIPHTDGDAFLSEGNRLLYCFRREGAQPTPWRIRAAGIILQINDIVEQDQPKSAFVAYDPWQYLYSRPCVKSDGSLPDESGLIFSGQRGDEIAHAIIKRTIDAHGSVFTDIGADGGTAFYGGTLHSTPQLDIQFVQGTTVGEALTQLAETAGIDIFFSPIYDPLNRPGYIAELNIYNQQGSIKRSAVMGWDKPGRNITTLDRMEDGTQRANVAQYFRTNSIPVGAVQDVVSETKFGQYWSTQSFPSDFPASYVEALAAEAVLVRKSHPTTVRVTPAPEMAPVPFAEYFIGDQLPVIASKRFRKPLSVLARVYSLPIDINDNCIEQVEALEFSSDALTPVTTKVLQARCLSSDPSGTQAVGFLGGGSTPITGDIWLSFDVAFGADYIAREIASYSEDDIVRLLNASNVEQEDFGVNDPTSPTGIVKWMASNCTEFTVGGPVLAETWYHIDWHSKSSPAAAALFVNAIDQSITHRATVHAAARAAWGVTNYSGSGTDVYIYYKDIKAGTTKGASDLFDGTDLTVWPFSSPAAPTARLAVIDDPF